MPSNEQLFWAGIVIGFAGLLVIIVGPSPLIRAGLGYGLILVATGLWFIVIRRGRRDKA